jgi:hypothetical protein
MSGCATTNCDDEYGFHRSGCDRHSVVRHKPSPFLQRFPRDKGVKTLAIRKFVNCICQRVTTAHVWGKQIGRGTTYRRLGSVVVL